MTHITRRVFAAISRRQHPATHSAFLRQILLKKKAVRLKHDIFVMPETIKLISKTIPSILIYHVQVQNQLRIKCIQTKITKPTQNQVYSNQNHKTNSESSVFKPKSTSHTRDKKADIKNNTPATDALVK